MTISSICPSALITYMYCKVIFGACLGTALLGIAYVKLWYWNPKINSHIFQLRKSLYICYILWFIHTEYLLIYDYCIHVFGLIDEVVFFFNLLKFWWLFLFPTFCVHVVIRISKYQWQFLLVQNYFTGFFGVFSVILG